MDFLCCLSVNSLLFTERQQRKDAATKSCIQLNPFIRNLKKSIYILLLSIVISINITAQTVIQPFSRLEILFAGDLMQHQSQLNAARLPDGTFSYGICYEYIKHYIRPIDIAVANLETPIAGIPYSGYPNFCAPDSFLYAAKESGFDVMLLANNHCLDRGKKGVYRTLSLLDSIGMQHCGVYKDSTDRAKRHPLIIKKNGISVAILNYTYGTNGIPIPHPVIVDQIDKKTIENDIKRVRSIHPDVIIAAIHWGDEFTNKPNKEQQELADWLLQQGVDHIIGNHPHVLQPIEIRQDSMTPARNAVVYSLGNLISGMFARGRDGGAIVTLNLQKICGITQLRQLKYLLTWVARPERDGMKNFQILPAVNPPVKLRQITKSKLNEFVNDSHKLLYSNNRLIKEDTVFYNTNKQ